jgi:tetratricopeptide (TPR) repeat protein
MHRTTLLATVSVVSLTSLVLAHFATGQTRDNQLGKVAFETSCTPAAQAQFNRAMLYQHSFWYRASQRAFEEVSKTDPACAMAHWGIALSLLWNPHVPPPAKNLGEGAAAIEKAKASPPKSQRERDYVDALAEMYKDHEKVDHRTRMGNYAAAMEKLAKTYPKDDEAQIYYALALNTSASPADKTYASQLKGAAILEKIAPRQPQHPGVAHYLIHLYDYPAIAQKGLAAAQRYAKIAPDAPHALHMPSHIFTRVGYWKDSIDSNTRSAQAAKESKEQDDQLHAMDYLVYAHLQLSQEKKAKAVLDEMKTVSGYSETRWTGPYALAASPARYAVERNAWAEAAELEVKSNPAPHVVAVSHYARALGAARTGKVAAANAEIAKLEEAHKALTERKDAYWAGQVDITRQVATAWVLHAEGKFDDALKALSAAADAEDKTDKHPVTPGPLAPARELYASMLLDRGQAKEALAAYEAVLKKEPNRILTYAGAAKSAAKAGDRAKAQRYYAKIVELAAGADTMRPEVTEARAFVAKKG